MIVLLHNIRSLYNVGSIFRTADGAGIEKIYLCGITPEPFDRLGKPRPQFTKVSLGAEHFVPWEHVASTTALVRRLKKEEYTIFAIEQAKHSVSHKSVKLEQKDLKKIAIVFGNEVRGLSPALLKLADKVLEIPMNGEKESLNVGVAFGIVAYHLQK